MNHSDIVYEVERRNIDNPVPCPNEGQPVKSGNGQAYSSHGTLTVHASGQFLVCARCGFQQPTSRI